MNLTSPKIVALRTAVPGPRYTQGAITDYYLKLIQPNSRSRERAIGSVMHQSGVAFRHLAIETQYFDTPRSTQERNDRYMAEALPLGQQVIACTLQKAGVAPDAVHSLIIVSCTGFNTPGLDLLLARRLKMSTRLHRTCILGMGCYGAFPGLKRAFESVIADPHRLALMLSLEICSAHLQSDSSNETIVSTSLFGDGAGAVLIGGADAAQPGPSLVDTETYCDYETLDHMTFMVTDQGFRMYLSRYLFTAF